MKNRSSLVAALGFATALLGCAGHAGIHYQDQKGGILTLEGDADKAAQDAHRKMGAHCGAGNYQIVKRERVVVGQETYEQESTDYEENEESQRTADQVDSEDSDSVADESYASESSVAETSVQEDEKKETTGNVASSRVSGTRDVHEMRIHYRCGHAG